ncbi:hypothetical protein POPTR_002G241500v4 [Populus trichocarpa]|uniref:Basic blue protein n=1 Tax=Populus trichocarpa TaxID=3694 RepID=B9GNJ7_POPTR|nr:basic blue protein [Populus trichocarpa]KAI5599761.1 hypothetical protein BDE02_02G216500 [Populus trichocarpa]PNT51396.1 hypothetical protein POPTR_002G241500v4 [Populus trichocarpa]|eukprot:XP_002303034.1 basic blue protein [Populus trichocarpa]
MARQGRCSAIGVVLASTLLVILSLQFKIAIAKAATFTVGDTSGWTFNIQSWTDGKKFKAGDSLIFNYDPSLHDVATVDVDGYDGCTLSPSSSTYTSGKDTIKLKEGQNYFICSLPSHCDWGLKIAVNASA